MEKRLQLKDLFVGKTDAKNELLESRELFEDSFLIPENINIKDFYNGGRYYITGLKGTGKTALLRYIALSMEKENATTSFVLFKSDFTEEDKNTFSKAANTTMVQKNDDTDNEESFVSIWLWFFHRQIVKLSQQGKSFFEDNSEWEKYSKCVLAPKLGNEDAGIMKLFPRIKRGKVEVGGDIAFLQGKLGLEFDLENKNNKQVDFSNIIRQTNELFKKLKPTNNKLFVFLDELELTLGKKKQYDKDIKLIRDLIIAVNQINTLSKQHAFPLYFITAIRSEVLTSVQAAGQEINKPILDFGIALKWQQSGGNIKDHPLIKIINKKIQASERKYDFEAISTEEEVWKSYFPARIGRQDFSAQEYILRRTWYRPRDIVRILTIAQQQCPNETSFSQKVFDTIVKEYSMQSWIELIEELRTKYTENEINGIRLLLTDIECPFTLNSISVISDSKKELYSDVDMLMQKHKLGDILSVLYNIGIIGNTGQNVRYAFRGDEGLVLESKMKVHDPLWSYLSIRASEK